jgi:ring-1,2-phenylacetyl-CoA epoxidase subunit PaaD
MSINKRAILTLLDEVKDPEIPVISLVDLGMITDVAEAADGHLKVTMTPTFVGCPAIQFMQAKVKQTLVKAGYANAEVVVDHSTPWSSNRITERGLQQLQDFRLSPPPHLEGDMQEADLEHARCPHCGSTNTSLRSPFGPTLCRALHFCYDCKQAFEQFKPV